MKHIFLSALFVFFLSSLFAQQEKYSQVRIHLDDRGMLTLAKMGIPVDEGVYKKGVSLTTVLSRQELAKVARAGYSWDVLQDDYVKFIEKRNAGAQEKVKYINAHKQELYGKGITEYPVPQGFHLGSMGGFFTPDEVLHELDSLHLKYPGLVTTKQILPGSTTVEGRSIYYIKISDNPNTNENEPKVLYTSLTHAREPEGMQQMFFFLNWLLENYNTDPEAQYLVNGAEIYFIPIVNPDGYAYNYSIAPNGGGMWRKNRLYNGDGTFGVDLNRNFGYKWGYDDTGSSPNTGDETYRGTGPFSEAETQDYRDFATQKGFKLAMNFHTYQDIFIYPWSYINQDTPDSIYFVNFGKVMTQENHYPYGTPGALLYTTNGDANDWCYGEQSAKPKAYAFTAEIGGQSDGFWPPVERIIPLCQEMMLMDILATHLVLAYAEAEDKSPVIIPDREGYFKYELTRYGLDYTGIYTVSIIPLDNYIISTGTPKEYQYMPIFHPTMDSLSYVLDPSIQPGTRFSYLLNVYDGHCNHYDTIVKYFGTPIVVLSDSCNNFDNWTSGKWNITTSDYFTPPSSITDSPSGYYSGNENNSVTLKLPVSVQGSPVAVVNFNTRWMTEMGYDYVQFKYTTDNGANWYPLKGKYTRPGTDYEQPGQPLYDGFQYEWVPEETVITDTSGNDMKLRFTLRSDAYTNYDGFYFDDFTVTIIDMSTLGTGHIAGPEYSLSDPVPNPADSRTTIYFHIPSTAGGMLVVTDLQGRQVRSCHVDGNMKSVVIYTGDLKPGIYFYRIAGQNAVSEVKKLVIR
jgi:carboxypeptidase T